MKNFHDGAVQTLFRFYMIRLSETQGILRDPDKDDLVLDRPTKWTVFLKTCMCYFLRICTIQYGFVRLPIQKADQMFSRVKCGVLHPGKIRINGDIYYIESCIFLNICLFCLEGIQYGTFFKVWNWRL